MAGKNKKPVFEKKSDTTSANRFWSIILFTIGIFILLLSMVEGTAGWFMIHNIIRGAFGVSVFLVAPVLIYAAVMIAKEKSSEIITGRIIQGVCLIFIVSAIVQVVFVGEVDGTTLSYKISALYDDGIKLKGGGVVSALLAIPLLDFFGETGAKIVIFLLLFVFAMLISNIGLLDLFHIIVMPFKNIHDALNVTANEDNISDAIKDKIKIGVNETDSYDENIDKLSLKERVADFFRGRVYDEEDYEENEPPKKKKSANSDKSRTQVIDIPKEALEDKGFFNQEEFDGSSDNSVYEKSEKIDETEKSLDEFINKAVESPQKSKKKKSEKIEEFTVSQQSLSADSGEYIFPSTEILSRGTDNSKHPDASNELRHKADTLVNTLKSFGVETRIVGIDRGPTVTRYEIQPSAGVKISRITNLSNDIALNLAANGVRIEAPIPGKSAVGIEVPNTTKDMVSLREILESNEFRNAKSKLAFAVGKDIAGKVMIGDIAKMPHVIIAGATGSGKSVCTNSIIMSILYNATPDEVKLILIDPKIVEFQIYEGIPHLLVPVVTEAKKAAGALNWAVQEMLRRYQLFADNNVRDLKGYNEQAKEKGEKCVPQIVIIVDELSDLMVVAKNEVEDAILRLSQMARAAGMHLIIATQRPSVNVITGVIKANIPSRIALSVASYTDSKTILDMGGAEKLIGHGDMLYLAAGMPKPLRIQGCFASDKEIKAVVDFIKANAPDAEYSNDIIDKIEKSTPVDKSESQGNNDLPDDCDELLEDAINIVCDMGQASTSALQRKLKLGYARAARIMDQLEQLGIIGPSEGAKPRQLLLSKAEIEERRMRNLTNNAD